MFGLPAFLLVLSSPLTVLSKDVKKVLIADEIVIFYLIKSSSRYLGSVQSSSLTTNSNLSI